MSKSAPDSHPAAHAASYLALGDSYTIGQAIAEAGRWPVQLAERLCKRGCPVQLTDIIAKTGWTTDELATAICDRHPPADFDLVSLLIGVNNQYRGRELSEYRLQLDELLAQCVRLAKGNNRRVLVLSIPDWGVTPFAAERDGQEIARQIDAFNEVKRTSCERRAIAYIDVTPITRSAAEDPSLIAPDGLHPSALMYQQWVDLAWPTAESLLKTQWSGRP